MTFNGQLAAAECLHYAGNAFRLLAANGAQPDSILRAEAADKAEDSRLGISLVARPSAEVVKRLQALQAELAKIEPDQYYYPDADLHLTILAVAWEYGGRGTDEVAGIAESAAAKALHGNGRLAIEPLTLLLDHERCALHFVPCDDALTRLRISFTEALAGCGEKPYPLFRHSAHVNFMRFIHANRAPSEELKQYVSRQILPFEWTIDALEVWSGSCRYGMQNRLATRGVLKAD